MLKRVHDHHARFSRGIDVDVVQADSGAGHHPEPAGRRDGLGVDLRRASHDHGVNVYQGCQQLVPVFAVGIADLERGFQQGDPSG